MNKLPKFKSFIIPFAPISWKRAGLSRGRCFYDTQLLDKEATRNYILQQFGDLPLYNSPISMDIKFYMPINRYKVKEGYPHNHFPDIDNLQKYLFDCCSHKIIMSDDRIISKVTAEKIFSSNPRTEFTIEIL